MVRSLPFLVGLAVLLGGGVAHGLWTDRWWSPDDLMEAAARVEALPDDPLAEEKGGWRAEKYEQDPEELKVSGAVAHWGRMFTHADTGEKVLVILLCGKAKQMSVHRPEHCYRSAGYEMTASARRVWVADSGRSAELWSGNFARDEAGVKTGEAEQIRIYWSWYAPGASSWKAPDSPRLAFAGKRVVYKMYVIRNLTTSIPAESDPSVELLGRLLPILDNALAPF
jgi:hypothetical protein